ncbi:hypothetical protein [Glutamicibacter sp. FBE19]|uniref:hypothetical protein n=1 Tax=Glutamicibacter sp. FBE19 TaxID=2761534 RepID=UPI0019D67EF1|nr:hypothetical protein [Glutamicibacter sp. FBE19]MBF6671566.1 hypothetical protein [Glutamicibacter sp. FBE19]
MYEPNPLCPEHFRQRPPHRLADGTWSDGVDRSKRIVHQTSHECHQNRVFVWRYYDRIKMKDLWVAERQDPWFDKEFDSFAEAIAYADRTARTTTNGEM